MSPIAIAGHVSNNYSPPKGLLMNFLSNCVKQILVTSVVLHFPRFFNWRVFEKFVRSCEVPSASNERVHLALHGKIHQQKQLPAAVFLRCVL